jgi:hypothetical protein
MLEVDLPAATRLAVQKPFGSDATSAERLTTTPTAGTTTSPGRNIRAAPAACTADVD